MTAAVALVIAWTALALACIALKFALAARATQRKMIARYEAEIDRATRNFMRNRGSHNG